MIYVGTLSTNPDRDSNWISAFRELGCIVIPFCTQPQLMDVGFYGRICRRFSIGRINKQMQQKLLDLVNSEKPVWIHFRLPIDIDRKTIQTLTSRNILVTQYFNDDPFSKRAPFGLYWKFRHALPAYDAHFVYRTRNIERFRKAGASYVAHCAPTYDPKRHYVSGSQPKAPAYLADVAFIGHWENDWRIECLASLKRNGYSVILKGGGWNEAIRDNELGSLAPIAHAFGEEYNYIYGNVAAGLCFFSKINNDSWTERALEIVAVGGILVCERTQEAQTHFNDREEAYFFSTVRELVSIIGVIKSDPESRERVRAAGYSRLMRSSNTIGDRARQIFNFVETKIDAAQRLYNLN